MVGLNSVGRFFGFGGSETPSADGSARLPVGLDIAATSDAMLPAAGLTGDGSSAVVRTVLGTPIDGSVSVGARPLPLEESKQPLTLGAWVLRQRRPIEQIVSDRFYLRRAVESLLSDRGISKPTTAQYNVTKYALIDAVKGGNWENFVAPSAHELKASIAELDFDDVDRGNCFFEREYVSSSDLEHDKLKWTNDRERARLEESYGDGVTGQMMAATLIGRSGRSSRDFSYAYGEAAWMNYQRCWAMLHAIPKGEFLSRLNIDLLTETNRAVYAEDPRKRAAVMRFFGALTRGRYDKPGRIREGGTYCEPCAYTQGEIDNMQTLGIRFHRMYTKNDGRIMGVMHYPDPADVNKRLVELIDGLKSDLSGNNPDVIGAAARFCRSFVALHPFEDCNGRTARILMNLILAEYDFPPAIMTDQDNDMALSEQEWRKQVAEGIAHTKRYIREHESYATDGYLASQGLELATPCVESSVVLDGLPYRLGQDGFLYSAFGRPHLVEGKKLMPLGQVDYYMLARRLLAMKRGVVREAFRQVTAETVALCEAATLAPDRASEIEVLSEEGARKADASYQLSSSKTILKIISGLVSADSISASRLFVGLESRGTPVSWLLSKYTHVDLDLWYLEAALKKNSMVDEARVIHTERCRLFEMTKQELNARIVANWKLSDGDEGQYSVSTYEKILYESSPLRYESLDAAISAIGDDRLTMWRGDYSVARFVGMTPNNDPREPSARAMAGTRFDKGEVPRLLSELKSHEASPTESRYLSHTSDPSLLISRFASNTKHRVIGGAGLGAIGRGIARLTGLASSVPPQGSGRGGGRTSAPVCDPLGLLGVPGDLFEVGTSRGGHLEVGVPRKAFQISVPKQSVLPGMVALAQHHTFAQEQELHGLDRVGHREIQATFLAEDLTEETTLVL